MLGPYNVCRAHLSGNVLRSSCVGLRFVELGVASFTPMFSFLSPFQDFHPPSSNPILFFSNSTKILEISN